MKKGILEVGVEILSKYTNKKIELEEKKAKIVIGVSLAVFAIIVIGAAVYFGLKFRA